ncbi:MAG: hypothetical protein ABIF01_02055 [Candidatus Micrarchaeota archaeon]
MKALIAYYSMTGTTEKVAKELGAFLESEGHEATLEAIVPKKGYSRLSAYTIGCMQARRRHLVELNPAKNNPSEFDIIAVLSPTWAFTFTPPAYSFISNLPKAKEGQKAIVITTNQGTPGDGPRALAETFMKKGYCIIGELTVTKNTGLTEIFAKEIKM